MLILKIEDIKNTQAIWRMIHLAAGLCAQQKTAFLSVLASFASVGVGTIFVTILGLRNP